MSDTSAILGLPYLMPSQAQKHVTHNEALARLDLLVQLRVEALEAETPPRRPKRARSGGWARRRPAPGPGRPAASPPLPMTPGCS